MTVSGRDYRRTRPRGFVEWNPAPATAALIDAVSAVLDAYADHLPLTLRQVFYVLVGQHGYDKTERAYKRLGEAVNRARRALLIGMDAIRDDGTTSTEAGGWTGVDDFQSAVAAWARGYRRDLGASQPDRIELWVEAAGMVPQAVRVARAFGVDVYSSGGFDSTTAKYVAAQRLVDDGRPPVILHVGDYDPSGLAIIDSAAEDVTAFAVQLGGIEPEWRRIAVTPEQIEAYGLPTAPQKATDRRGGEVMAATVQAESLPPDTLAAELTDALEVVIDDVALRAARQAGEDERAQLLDELRDAGWL